MRSASKYLIIPQFHSHVNRIELLLLRSKEAKETVVLLRFIPGGFTSPPVGKTLDTTKQMFPSKSITFPMEIAGNPLRVEIQSPKKTTNTENLHHLWPKNHIAEVVLLQECLQLSPLLAPSPCSLDSSLQLSERKRHPTTKEKKSDGQK